MPISAIEITAAVLTSEIISTAIVILMVVLSEVYCSADSNSSSGSTFSINSISCHAWRRLAIASFSFVGYEVVVATEMRCEVATQQPAYFFC